MSAIKMAYRRKTNQKAPAPYDRSAVTTHGLYVRAPIGRKLRDARVRALARKAREALPWLQDADEPTIRSWAMLEILCESAYEILRDKGITTNGTEPRKLLTDFRQLTAIKLVYQSALGMTPASRDQIKAAREGRAFDLAEHAAQEALAISDARKLRKEIGAPRMPRGAVRFNGAGQGSRRAKLDAYSAEQIEQEHEAEAPE